MKPVDSMMQQAVAEHVFPGGRLLVSLSGKILFNEAYGLANLYTGQVVTRNTVYDLASLTKPLAATLAVMLLVQEEKLHLEQTLASIIPAFNKMTKADIQIRHLLNHTSGFPDYRPYYKGISQLPLEQRKDALRKNLILEPLVSGIGEKTLYSDIGFMVLEWAIELVSGARLNDFVKERIYDPIGIENLFFIVHDQCIPDKNYAATELCPWRQILLNGRVHDDNAYVMGGVAGHAGLFGTAESVHAIVLELLKIFHGESSEQIFQSDLVRLFFHKSNKNDRSLGFDVPSQTGSSCGELFNRDATVGHLGFTGTSFWVDLEQQVIVILLTNRVHPSRNNEQIKKFRPLIHNQVMKQLRKLSTL
ncbi:MAG: beta-lactamase family protein [Desulfobacteraceae bacterium]|nr:beta-lactamase family protein [Desulfobacteraceae bacterium]MBC2755899.1 beta-lactamase family protein [Desulfobacteraceae bacterium]